MSQPAAVGLAASARRNLRPALARAALTLAVLAALLAWLPTDALLAGLGSVGVGTWALTLLGFAVGHAVAAGKWRMLLGAAGLHLPALRVLRAHGAGLFANLCLPSLVGGDVVRAGMIAGSRDAVAPVAVASVADRVVDSAALVALAAGGAALLPVGLPDAGGRLLGVAAFALLAGVVVAFGLLPRLDAARLPGALGRAVARLASSLGDLARRPRTALAALLLALLIQAGFVLLNARLGNAVGIEIPLALWFLAWPLAKLVALVPISLGGIGVREAALAGLLLPFGVEPALAVAQSLVWETVLVALGLVAGATSLWMGRRAGAGAVSQ